jgi:hypothetical protein
MIEFADLNFKATHGNNIAGLPASQLRLLNLVALSAQGFSP